MESVYLLTGLHPKTKSRVVINVFKSHERAAKEIPKYFEWSDVRIECWAIVT